MDCSLPGSLAKNTGVGCHALLQVSSQPRDWTDISQSPALAGGFFTTVATWAPDTSRAQQGFLFSLAPSLFFFFFSSFTLYGAVSPFFPSSILDTYWRGWLLFQCHTFSFHCVHRVLKARILKWFAIPFSSGPHFVRPWLAGTLNQVLNLGFVSWTFKSNDAIFRTMIFLLTFFMSLTILFLLFYA